MPLATSHLLGLKHKTQTLSFLDRLVFGVLALSLTLLILAVCAGSSLAATGGAATEGGATYQPTPATTPGLRAKISADGRTAIAPVGAPLEVQKAIWAANKITKKRYYYGGGHGSFKKIDRRGYDCSGTISYALGNAGLQETTLNSTGYFGWGVAGQGDWITVYTNSGHAYVVIAGLRLDTSGPGERGPRWRKQSRSSKGFRSRHPEGF